MDATDGVAHPPATSRGILPLPPETVARIGNVGHLRQGGDSELDVDLTLEFFRKRYVQQIGHFRRLDADTVVADIGAGYGWLAMAFALFTPARVIAVELDGPLEHVRRNDAALRDLARISRDVVILTTPNLWFPVIAHDTELPFCHGLPLPWRARYALLFDRTDRENDNLFWSPLALNRLMPDYRVVSGFPFKLPYIGRGLVQRPGRLRGLYYRLAASLGGASRFVLPNLACVLRRTSPAATATARAA